MTTEQALHVAVGVVRNNDGKILIAQRPQHVHQGGLWEFPGGKVENGEAIFVALQRELQEEMGIRVLAAQPLIKIPFQYPDKLVLLDVWQVDKFDGMAHGCEGQPYQWVEADNLHNYAFPAANHAIIMAVQLPQHYMITGLFHDMENLLRQCRTALQQGIRLVQFRAPWLETALFFQYAQALYKLCQEYQARLLLNTSWQDYQTYNAAEFSDGIHFSQRNLPAAPLTRSFQRLLAVSVHNDNELQQAETMGADFVVLSPVKQTTSHPDAAPLGWQKFSDIVESSRVPVYALGGMCAIDLVAALQRGAQGIAAISMFWGEKNA